MKILLLISTISCSNVVSLIFGGFSRELSKVNFQDLLKKNPDKRHLSRLLGEEIENHTEKENEFPRLVWVTFLSIFANESAAVSASDVKYILYTREHWIEGQEITINDTKTLKNVDFISTRETIFVTHGWTDDGGRHFCQVIKTAYLMSGDFNVIVVDWGAKSKQTYRFARMSVPGIANHVVQMIDFLRRQGMEIAKGVGLSLGAHLLGIAGYELTKKLDYLVGLDPVRLGYHQGYPPSDGISRSSAKIVEIVHTGIFGIPEPLGHVDIYVNGGSNQCGPLKFGCSHNFAYKIFAASLLVTNKFCAIKCNVKFQEISNLQNMRRKCRGKTEPMGTNRREVETRGIFYLRAVPNYPYVASGNASKC